jgi:hypothetical protein
MRKMTLVNPPEVEIHTSKAPSSLEGAPYLAGKELSKRKKKSFSTIQQLRRLKAFRKILMWLLRLPWQQWALIRRERLFIVIQN